MNIPLDKELIANKVDTGNDTRRNNDLSFDTSHIEMRRTCKYKPPLNMSNLPSVFKMPRTNYNSVNAFNNNSNNNLHKQYCRVNLQPIKHIKPNIKIINENPIERGDGLKKPFRPQLKPIEIKDPRRNDKDKDNKRQNYHCNSDKELLLALANKHLSVKSLEKYSKTSEYYYQMLQKMEPEECKVEIKRLENYLKEHDKSPSSHSLLNKSMINEPIVLTQNKMSPTINKIKVLTVYNTLDNYNYNNNQYQQIDKHAYNVNEFMAIGTQSSNDKVLHIPSLKLYKMQVVQKTNSKDDYINDWQTLDHSVLEIIAVFKNYPNGSDSIVTEVTSNGSIDNLIKTTGTLNERIQKGIVIQLLSLIEYYCIRIRNHYDFIKPENICFDNRFNIILYPSISKEKKELRIETMLYERWSKVLKISKSKTNMKKDLFSLGILLFDINLAIIAMRTRTYLKLIKDEDYLNIDSYCCLYHLLMKLIPEFASVINEKYFSEQYLLFLCHITSFELTSEFSMNKIKKETWITMKNNTTTTPLYNLPNVLHMAKIYDFTNEYYTPNSQIRNFDILCESIKENLPFCEDYFNFYSIKHSNSIFDNKAINYDELAKELRVDINTLQSRLMPIYTSYFDQKTILF